MVCPDERTRLHLKSPGSPRERSGAAIPEFVIVMVLVLIPVLFGVWEIGRLVLVQQIVSNSAREGARLAAQARTINQNGSPTIINTSIAPAANTQNLPNVKAAVFQSLHGAGLTGVAWDDVTVTFTFLSSPAGAVPGATEPYQGVKDQRFSVTRVDPVRESPLDQPRPD